MNFATRTFQWLKKAVSDLYLRDGFYRLAANYGATTSTHTGKSVNAESALECSVVWASTRVISESVAAMPLHLMRQKGDSKKPALDHPLYEILHDQPNLDMTALEFREALTLHAVHWGRCYAKIIRRPNDGRVIGLLPIHPQDVARTEPSVTDGRIYFVTENGKEIRYPQRDIFTFGGMSRNGIDSFPVWQMARQSIALALILEEWESRLFRTGGKGAGIIVKKMPFKADQDRDRWRKEWNDVYGSAEGFHKNVLLEGEWDYKQISTDPEKAQFLQLRQFMISEICRWYRISPHLVADLSRATFSNIEQLAIEFVQHTLQPWIVRWEQAIRRCLLTSEERKTLFAKHNMSGLLRGDFQSRMTGYATMLQNGVFSINEVRDLEDQDPVEGGDAHHIQLNMQTVPGTGDQMQAQTQALIKVSDGNMRGGE